MVFVSFRNSRQAVLTSGEKDCALPRLDNLAEAKILFARSVNEVSSDLLRRIRGGGHQSESAVLFRSCSLGLRPFLQGSF